MRKYNKQPVNTKDVAKNVKNYNESFEIIKELVYIQCTTSLIVLYTRQDSTDHFQISVFFKKKNCNFTLPWLQFCLQMA